MKLNNKTKPLFLPALIDLQDMPPIKKTRGRPARSGTSVRQNATRTSRQDRTQQPHTAPPAAVLDQATLEAIAAVVSKQVSDHLAAQVSQPQTVPATTDEGPKSSTTPGAVAASLASLGLPPATSTGQLPQSDPLSNGTVMGSLGSMPLTLECLVAPELAQDIAEGKYIEFNKLLPNFKRAASMSRSDRPPPIESFNDWLSAFFRFSSVKSPPTGHSASPQVCRYYSVLPGQWI